MSENILEQQEVEPVVAPVKAEGKAKAKPEKEAPVAPKDDLDDLPDDIKKKLEKNKQARIAKLKKAKGKKSKKVERTVTVGKAFINSTYNNTIVTITDLDGNVISWANAGLAGFKGPKKSTPYAATIICKIAVARAKEQGLNEVSVFVKGVGTGRESAVRALNANGLNVTYIKDVTPIPHNGCRARKPRRV
jgi:small subunit ribosomal protein S11